ncbi:MAG: hypothetical protein LBD58_00895 [Treponema sp.]|jgi:hypothetical protein|nr:hypothetical protein [Treponema sp.]
MDEVKTEITLVNIGDAIKARSGRERSTRTGAWRLRKADGSVPSGRCKRARARRVFPKPPRPRCLVQAQRMGIID